ncbi:hypothetical protein Tco_1318607 [Tanacetum coccineum]
MTCNPTAQNLVPIRLAIDVEGQRGCRFFFWFDDHILLSSLISTFSDKPNCKNDQDIVWNAFNENYEAKIVQRTALDSQIQSSYDICRITAALTLVSNSNKVADFMISMGRTVVIRRSQGVKPDTRATSVGLAGKHSTPQKEAIDNLEWPGSCDNHDLSRFDNQSIERDRLIGIGFVLDFMEFISFAFSDKEMILVIEVVSR